MPATAPDTGSYREKRLYPRSPFSAPVRFKSYSRDLWPTDLDPSIAGISQNISLSGLLFEMGENPPQISQIVWLNLDLRSLKFKSALERRAFRLGNGLLSKVMRIIPASSDNLRWLVGVHFLVLGVRDFPDLHWFLSGLGLSDFRR